MSFVRSACSVDMGMVIDGGILMGNVLKRIFIRIRMSLFPTKHDKEVKRWLSDGGDSSLRFNYDLNEQSIVLDLGGYKGQWASDIYARYNCRIMIFEPVRLFAEKIKKRFERNFKIEVFCFALGASQRRETVTLGDDGTSVYRNGSSKEMIQFEDVVTFFDEHGISEVELMKINIEGGEYELLPKMIEAGLVRSIKNIQIQFHDIDSVSEKRMRQIRSDLLKTHVPTYQYEFVWENWERVDS